MSDIFISYARSTAAQAKQIAEALRALGYGVWRDDEIPANRAYADVIAERLCTAKAVVVIWSAEAAKSSGCSPRPTAPAQDGKLVQLSVDGAACRCRSTQIQCADLIGWSGDRTRPAGSRSSAPSPISRQRPRPPASGPHAGVRKLSICVLPFANMSGDAEQEYFSDGISEDIITDLCKVSALSVIARNTAFAFKGKIARHEAGRPPAGRRHVLEGSVRKAGGRVRITAQLIDGARNDHVWAERYDRDLTDIFALQDDISRGHRRRAEAEAAAGGKEGHRTARHRQRRGLRRLPEGPRTGPSAGWRGVLARAIGHLEEAVRLDPEFALAWAWLATANFFLPEHNDVPDWKSYLEAGKKAARQAFKLDPNLSDANLALAYARLLEVDLPGQWEARKRAQS